MGNHESCNLEENIHKFVQNDSGDVALLERMLVDDSSYLEGTFTIDINSQDVKLDYMTALMYQSSKPSSSSPSFPPQQDATAADATDGGGGGKTVIEVMEWLLAHQPRSADPNIRSKTGATALFFAVVADDPVKVRLLLDYGADRNIPNNEGVAPLDYARMENISEEVVSLLFSYFPVENLGKKAEAIAKLEADKIARDVIKKFVQNSSGDIAVMDVLLRGEYISDMNVRDGSYFDYTALMWQSRNGSIEVMEWLLTRDPPADVNFQNKRGDTALFYAAYANSPEKVRLLLAYGANRHIKNYYDNDTPLKLAKRLQYYKIVSLLETYNPDIKRGKGVKNQFFQTLASISYRKADDNLNNEQVGEASQAAKAEFDLNGIRGIVPPLESSMRCSNNDSPMKMDSPRKMVQLSISMQMSMQMQMQSTSPNPAPPSQPKPSAHSPARQYAPRLPQSKKQTNLLNYN